MGNLVLNGATSGATTITPTDAVTVTTTFPSLGGTVMVSGNMPAFSAYGSGTQTISNGVYTKVAFNTKLFDTNTNYDATTNYRFTPTVAGYYQVNGTCYFGTVTTGLGIILIYKNGSYYSLNGTSLTATNQAYLTVSGLVYCNGSTDYIEIYVYQNSGTTVSIGSQNNSQQFSGVLVRSA